MREAIENAKSAGPNGEVIKNLPVVLIQKTHNYRIPCKIEIYLQISGAVIVDPQTGTILAKASDKRFAHPLQHAAMVAIDLIAGKQHGGAWFPEGMCSLTRLYLPGYTRKFVSPTITDQLDSSETTEVRAQVALGYA